MVGELHNLCDGIEAGLALNEAARVRTAPIDVRASRHQSQGRSRRQGIARPESSDVCRFPGCRAIHVAALGSRTGGSILGSAAGFSAKSVTTRAIGARNCVDEADQSIDGRLTAAGIAGEIRPT